jgi:hypothetical protein
MYSTIARLCKRQAIDLLLLWPLPLQAEQIESSVDDLADSCLFFLPFALETLVS